MYYAILFCNKETLELRQFLENVVSTQSPRALLLAIVNTLQSQKISWRNKVFLGEIYRAVEKMFDLQLGKILIALSTPSQLISVMDHDLPYLSAYEKPIKRCLTDGKCQEVRTGFKLMVTLQSGCVPEILTLCRMNKIFFKKNH